MSDWIKSDYCTYCDGEFSELFTKLPKDTHAKYTARAIKEGKWVITSITEQK